jgi:DNA-binding response OmpR family regulator
MPHSVQTTTAPACYCLRQQGEDVHSETRLIILLVEEDDDTRPTLKRNLERDGYRVLIALSEEDALDRTSGDHIRADLILLNLVGASPDDALKVGQRIREHARYDGATPIVVMAEKYGKDLEGTDAQVGEKDWITYLEDPDQLRNLLARILSGHSD